MGSWPDVNPGQAFEPSAQLENDVRHLVNRRGLAGVRANGGGMQVENICINAYNPSDVPIADGDAVVIPEGALSEGAFPVATLAEYELWKNNWGIAQGEIAPHQYGSVLVMGVAIVPIVSETGTDTFEYVVPVGNGELFKKSKRGIARYIRPIGTDYALIFVGISSGLVFEQGKGVKISGGTFGIPPTISAEIESGTDDIDITGGSDGNPYVISFTGESGATGIGSTISGNAGIITLIGGTGSVTIAAGDNVSITGSNNMITISVTGGTPGPGPQPSTDGVKRIVLSAIDIYTLSKNCDYIIYYPYPYNSQGSKTNQYSFVTTTSSNNAIASIETVIGKSVVRKPGYNPPTDNDDGFFDPVGGDYGNMILILPLNPTHLCSVRVFASPGSTRVAVVSVEGKRIVDNNGGSQGDNNGVFTDYVEGDDYLYVYVSSVTGWPSRYAYGYNYDIVIAQVQTAGGCWVRINLN